MKRVRVTAACDSCHIKKLKCDGRRPVCERCAAYSYSCHWTSRRAQNHAQRRLQMEAAYSTDDNTFAGDLQHPSRLTYEICEDFILDLFKDASSETCFEIGTLLARIRARLPSSTSQTAQTGTATPTVSATTTPSPTDSITVERRFLGEVSDVHFFNVVKRSIDKRTGLAHVSDGSVSESYDIDEISPSLDLGHCLSMLPSPSLSDNYIHAYFETVQVSYPFIQRSSFARLYRNFREDKTVEPTDYAWLALLYSVFAIGAYLMSFAEGSRSEDQVVNHSILFRISEILNRHHNQKRSLTSISALLCQCFYLLASSKTDKCWVVLGSAIRTAQSLGMHIQGRESPLGTDITILEPVSRDREAQSQIWYCLYVLDRLVALQTGRPPGISDSDCHVSPPMPISNCAIIKGRWDSEEMQDGHCASSENCPGEYLGFMIQFSCISGRVSRELYSPLLDVSQRPFLVDMLDQELISWKKSLPRQLRFDMGYALGKSHVIKRQRNLLGLKFHHLRALIHRPCLDAGLNTMDVEPASATNDDSLTLRCEKICIDEAQNTARMFHNVTDIMELVYEFPFWQAISCLLSAASILVVADVRLELNTDSRFDSDLLREDADLCLKVFEAMSSGSSGAKLAAQMLRKLRSAAKHALSQHKTLNQTHRDEALQTLSGTSFHDSDDHHVNNPAEVSGIGSTRNSAEWQDASSLLKPWPMEVAESMIWSTNFFNQFLPDNHNKDTEQQQQQLQ